LEDVTLFLDKLNLMKLWFICSSHWKLFWEQDKNKLPYLEFNLELQNFVMWTSTSTREETT